MNRHCHNCGKEWELDGLLGRSESCHGCNEDLRICLNCMFHDSSAAYQCRERRADPVTEKNGPTSASTSTLRFANGPEADPLTIESRNPEKKLTSCLEFDSVTTIAKFPNPNHVKYL